MESIFDYFSTIPSSHRALILVSGILFFWMLEGVVPLVKLSYKKGKHAALNIFFTITTIVVNFGLAFLLLQTSDWTIANEFGVLHWIVMPLWAQCVVGVLLLDLISAWLAHYMEHRVKVFWGFHLIHHTDHEVDTTTANRHHPGESVIRFAFTCLGVFIVGAPIAIIMLYQAISVVLSQFNHANIKLPKKVDTALSWILVSPDMHKVHHHYKLPYTDTNFGNIFAIWDRVFGTYSTMPNEDIVYGVDTHFDAESNKNIMQLLKLPFKKYKSPHDL